MTALARPCKRWPKNTKPALLSGAAACEIGLKKLEIAISPIATASAVSTGSLERSTFAATCSLRRW